jgi:hypothetical protein
MKGVKTLMQKILFRKGKYGPIDAFREGQNRDNVHSREGA